MNPAQKQEKRLVTWFFVIMGLLFMGGVLTGLAILPDKPISNYEKRLFCILLLSFLFIVIIVLYMIRSAVVANSAFLIRLRDAMISNNKSINDLEAQYRDLGRKLDRNVKAQEGLTKELSRLIDLNEKNG